MMMMLCAGLFFKLLGTPVELTMLATAGLEVSLLLSAEEVY